MRSLWYHWSPARFPKSGSPVCGPERAVPGSKGRHDVQLTASWPILGIAAVSVGVMLACVARTTNERQAMRTAVLCSILIITGCRIDATFYGVDGMGGSDGFVVTPLKTAVLEHEAFTLNVTAKDPSGNTVTSYNGTPVLTITSDWGDIAVTGTPTFTNGVAEFGVSLNRETNANNLAHIRVVEGVMTGQSSGVTVTPPAWVQDETTPYIAGSSIAANWDYKLTNDSPGLVLNASGFHLGYSGRNSSNVNSIGRMSSPDWNSASFLGQTLAPTGSGWEATGVGGPALGYDGTQYVMLYWGYGTTTGGIGLATSTDFNTWTRYAGNPVLVNTDPVCTGIGIHAIVTEGPNTYRIFGRTQPTSGNPWVCTALSTDGGKTWTNKMKLTSLDPLVVNGPLVVVKEGSVYRMWFRTLSPSTAYYATSSDGVMWVVSSTTPNFVPEIAVWDAVGNRYRALSDCGATTTAYCRGHRP